MLSKNLSIGVLLQSLLVKRDGGIGIDARTLLEYDVCYIMRIEESIDVDTISTAHRRLIQTFAFPDPSISGTRVMGRMRTISVIVNITLFLSSEALLYHLNEGLLILCICLTGNLCSLLVGEAYAIQKIYHSSRRIRYSESFLYPFGHALGSRATASKFSHRYNYLIMNVSLEISP